MKPILIFLLFFLASFTVTAQEQAAPAISFEKKLFSPDETVWLNYIGSPQPLIIKLQDDAGSSIGYKAVVSPQPGNKNILKLLPTQPWKHGSYYIQITTNQRELLNEVFSIGKTSASIQRTGPRLIEPDKNTRITLKIPPLTNAHQDQLYNLTEQIPFEAIISDQSIKQIKKPELLNLRFPFEGAWEVTAEFGQINPNEQLGIPDHDGVDFATPAETPIIAVDNGEVVPYREENNYGNTIALQHSWGQSYYGHLSTASAQIGTKVRKGEIVGLSGNTGRSTGPHLHFGIKWNDETYLDSLPLLSALHNEKSAMKQLVFENVRASSEIVYEIAMLNPDSKLHFIELEPASLTDTSSKKILGELDIHSLILSPSEGYEEIAKDPNLSKKTLFASQDGVIVWKNEDQSVLKGYDTITKTPFEQPLFADRANTLSIDTKDYKVEISPTELKLR